MRDEPPDEASLRISVGCGDSSPVVYLAGELDSVTGQFFVDVVAGLSDRLGPRVTVSMAGVTFLDARGITALLRARSLLQDAGGRLTLAALPTPCLRMLDLVDLCDAFELIPTAVDGRGFRPVRAHPEAARPVARM